MRNHVINLVSITHTTDANDNPVENRISREVFAEKRSVYQREFYAAAAYDLRPGIVYVVSTHDYHDETVIEDNGKEYQLIRTYQKGGEEIELICSGPGPRPRTR